MANAVVIGANRGIGLEVVRQLAARGDSVVAACRTTSPELDATSGVTVVTGVDVSKRASLDTLRIKVESDGVDQLWVVAGILRRVSLEDLDLETIRTQFEVNAIGPLQAVAALLPALREGSQVGLLTSRMGSIADNTSGGSYGYRMSKAALNMAGRSLAHDLRPRGISVTLLHPGFVRTDMTGGAGHIDAHESAAGLIKRLDESSMESTGSFYHQSGERLPW
ncbi:MAG: SDR family oxidoreductase [Myxococcota bacterium]